MEDHAMKDLLTDLEAGGINAISDLPIPPPATTTVLFPDESTPIPVLDLFPDLVDFQGSRMVEQCFVRCVDGLKYGLKNEAVKVKELSIKWLKDLI